MPHPGIYLNRGERDELYKLNYELGQATRIFAEAQCCIHCALCQVFRVNYPSQNRSSRTKDSGMPV